MFSVGKLALFIAIILVVLITFRLLGRRKTGSKAEGRIADTVRCKICGVYIPKSGVSPCDRIGCPY
ncbi:MAG: hypothetical protein CMM76_08300 [Rhodospirillaceae bacterium]|nr:hypothetical protein [Rhodospirillaceae bacterium]